MPLNPFSKTATTTTTAQVEPKMKMDSSRRKKLLLSYLPDWVLTILLWGLFYLLDKIEGYRRLFDITDSSISHPYAEHERIPVWMLAVLYGLVPAALILLTAGLVRRSFWDAHNGLLGFILGLGLTITFTNIVKITVGRPRPDLLARCSPPPGLQNPEYGLTSWTVCTTTEHLQDGFRSFPSGHSSFAWSGMTYLGLYAAGKMRIHNHSGYTIKSWLLLVPLSAAALCSISRTMDYRHHATDVIAGAIIGVLASWYAYRQFYPPLSHPMSGKPYSPRIPREDNKVRTDLPMTRHDLAGPNANEQETVSREPEAEVGSDGSLDGRGHLLNDMRGQKYSRDGFGEIETGQRV